MPEISRFYGIVIQMFFDDHPPPHFHVKYGEFKALIEINTLAVFAGNLPPRALGLVIEWASLYQEELRKNWQNAEKSDVLKKIDPLR